MSLAAAAKDADGFTGTSPPGPGPVFAQECPGKMFGP
jgi:hypothetical protein